MPHLMICLGPLCPIAGHASVCEDSKTSLIYIDFLYLEESEVPDLQQTNLDFNPYVQTSLAGLFL